MDHCDHCNQLQTTTATTKEPIIACYPLRITTYIPNLITFLLLVFIAITLDEVYLFPPILES